MQCLRDAVLRHAVAVSFVAWLRHSIANQSKQHKAFPLLIKSVPPQNLAEPCRCVASLFTASPCLRVESQCYSFAVPFYALLCHCCALRSCAFAAPYISLPLQNNAKRCFSNATPFLSKLRIAIAFQSIAIALPLHGQAWLFLCSAFPSNSYAFLRRSAASCSASTSCSRSDLGLTGVDRRTSAAGK